MWVDPLQIFGAQSPRGFSMTFHFKNSFQIFGSVDRNSGKRWHSASPTTSGPPILGNTPPHRHKVRRARKRALALFSRAKQAELRKSMARSFDEHGFTPRILRAMKSISDLKKHEATERILNSMAEREFCSMDRRETLRRLRENSACAAESMTAAELDGKLMGLVRSACASILASFWHQSKRRHQCLAPGSDSLVASLGG